MFQRLLLGWVPRRYSWPGDGGTRHEWASLWKGRGEEPCPAGC